MARKIPALSFPFFSFLFFEENHWVPYMTWPFFRRTFRILWRWYLAMNHLAMCGLPSFKAKKLSRKYIKSNQHRSTNCSVSSVSFWCHSISEFSHLGDVFFTYLFKSGNNLDVPVLCDFMQVCKYLCNWH